MQTWAPVFVLFGFAGLACWILNQAKKADDRRLAKIDGMLRDTLARKRRAF